MSDEVAEDMSDSSPDDVMSYVEESEATSLARRRFENTIGTKTKNGGLCS